MFSRHSANFSPSIKIVEVSVPALDVKSPITPNSETLSTLKESIRVEHAKGGHLARVTVTSAWPPYLMLPTNEAEVYLVAAVLYGLCDPVGGRLSKCKIVTLVKRIVGTSDWRCIHSGTVIWPIERLMAKGLIGKYRRPSRACDALARSRSGFRMVAAPIGTVISDPTKCERILTIYRDKMLESLVSDLRKLSRRHVLFAFASSYQAALGEQLRWRTSIRALRAIRGVQADRDAFELQNEVNSIRRNSKVICEIAACECGMRGSLIPGREEIERLQSKCSLIIICSQTLSGVRSGVFRPKVEIGSEGDLLISGDPTMEMLSTGLGWLNSKILDDSTMEYLRRRHPKSNDPTAIPDWYRGLCLAIESEYHIPFNVLYRDFASALCEIAEERHSSVFLIRQSRLIDRLRKVAELREAVTVKFLGRLILKRRDSWFDELTAVDRDLSRLDRAMSLINRPIQEVESGVDPLLLVVPALVSEACLYSVSSLIHGLSNQRLISSKEARRFAGKRGMVKGMDFEEKVADRISRLGFRVEVGWHLSKILNRKARKGLGDVDVLVINYDKPSIWIVEVKNLRLCRTSYEIVSRIAEYRGEEFIDRRGKNRPDKLLRHLRRVDYLLRHIPMLMKRFSLSGVPTVRGLLVFDSPQPVQIERRHHSSRCQSILFDDVLSFPF